MSYIGPRYDWSEVSAWMEDGFGYLWWIDGKGVGVE